MRSPSALLLYIFGIYRCTSTNEDFQYAETRRSRRRGGAYPAVYDISVGRIGAGFRRQRLRRRRNAAEIIDGRDWRR